MTYRIIVCGCRDWTDRTRLENAIMGALIRANTSNVEIVHGGCPTGADEIASRLCETGRINEQIYKADWNKFGKRAGPIRNEQMAKDGADLCIASWDGLSHGTKNMIDNAVRYGIRTLIIPKAQNEQSEK